VRRSLALTVSGLVVAAAVAHAQEEGATRLITLRGSVIDTAFRPVPGVLVYLSSARIFGLTDDQGAFMLADIEPGLDTLQVRGRGFEPQAFRLFLPDSVHGAIDVGLVRLQPGPPPALTVSVTARDTLHNRPVAGAEVMVNDRVLGETDTAGVLSGAAIPVDWGINTVLIRRVGYAPVIATLWVEDVHTRRVIEGVMQQLAVDLPAVVVEADRILFSYGRLRDFWLQRERGWGRFITQADIERRNPFVVSDLLRMIPGIEVRHVGFTTQIRSTRGAATCSPTIWLDGSPLPNDDVDAIVRPRDVAGIEVYSRYGETPAQFVRGFNACGAIVIWTR
jgi:hypothetical protein